MFEGKPKNPETVQPVAKDRESHEHVVRTTLADFISSPLQIEDVTSRNQFMSRIFPWLIAAMQEAGYSEDAIQFRTIHAFDKDKRFFNRDSSRVVHDVNRIIKNFYLDSKGHSGAGAITETVPTKLNSDIRSIEPVETSEAPTVLKSEVPLVVRNPLPPPLVLTSEQRVPDKLVLTSEVRIDVPDTYLEQVAQLCRFEIISTIEAIDFVNGVHTNMRGRYDAILTEAATNLRRYSELYTPSKTEKEALQYLATIQAKYVHMQSAESSLGKLRSQVMNNLEAPETNEVRPELQESLQKFAEAHHELAENINRLHTLIEIAQTEEKPPLAEAYRAQLEKMRVEGNQVLATVPADHPLYVQFESLLTNNLVNLIQTLSEEKGGNQTLINDQFAIMDSRNRIKAAIAYMKTDHEYEDFYNRSKRRTKELTLSAGKVPTTTVESPIINTLQANLVAIEQLLQAKNNIDVDSPLAFTMTDEVIARTEALKNQKQSIQNLLGETQEMISNLSTDPEVTTFNNLDKKLPLILTDPVYVPAQIRQAMLNRLMAVEALVPMSPTLRARATNILRLIKPRKIGLAATLAAFVSSLPSNSTEIDTVGSVVGGSTGISESQRVTSAGPELNYEAVFDYLRKVENITVASIESPVATPEPYGKTDVFAQTEAPTTLTSTTPLEIVPGVAFAATKDQVTTSSTPSLEIFSAQADHVPADMGIVFNKSPDELPDTLYQINFGDRFWDINEGQTLAGKLPVMQQINPYFRQSLIDRVRDKINRNSELRASIGGIGETADTLVTGEYINITELNKLATLTAIDFGYFAVDYGNQKK